MSDDRFRKHMRVPIPMIVEVKFDGDKDYEPYLLVDISWGGMYVKMDKPRSVGVRFVGRLPTMEKKDNCELKGKVVTQNKLVEGRSVAGVGLAFENIDQDSKSSIQKMIDRMLTKRS